jgi:hypothetical protein
MRTSVPRRSEQCKKVNEGSSLLRKRLWKKLHRRERYVENNGGLSVLQQA